MSESRIQHQITRAARASGAAAKHTTPAPSVGRAVRSASVGRAGARFRRRWQCDTGKPTRDQNDRTLRAPRDRPAPVEGGNPNDGIGCRLLILEPPNVLVYSAMEGRVRAHREECREWAQGHPDHVRRSLTPVRTDSSRDGPSDGVKGPTANSSTSTPCGAGGSGAASGRANARCVRCFCEFECCVTHLMEQPRR